jgi:hypothetical protein
VRKTVSPNVAIAVLVIVVLVVGWLFWKKVKGPRKIMMTPAGAIDPDTGQMLGGGRGRGRRGERAAEPSEEPAGRRARR